jgi:hypothetical protein
MDWAYLPSLNAAWAKMFAAVFAPCPALACQRTSIKARFALALIFRRLLLESLCLFIVASVLLLRLSGIFPYTICTPQLSLKQRLSPLKVLRQIFETARRFDHAPALEALKVALVAGEKGLGSR